MKVIESVEEFQQLISGDKAVVVDFFAQWCPPCKMIGPRFVKISEENPDVTCVKVDVDANTGAARIAGIRAMPTFKSFKNGQVIGEVVGANEGAIRQLVEKAKTA
ncbi:Thioredoxin [Carpediemonas membranifera]|uniref:Thioredoxin n=1 Tax=Carpediemonas membranifera TaxID=201153 RepID=A0A8J6BFY3_9EUKA|nr:Thioredoxin [Carpediemonas membranifera]KAG9396655.1 Thioredoxin [Carpediemonas membranifera]KAG9396662.1 Thioredoxin [Carpediemonas membranifera]KAG9396672.1 Thioredoxin [Carpediemonas membranifera]|eukprot:KAG9396654.1 Thioredoxin [Carpediemonas membranifera]